MLSGRLRRPFSALAACALAGLALACAAAPGPPPILRVEPLGSVRAEKPACFRLSRRVRGESGLADLACGEDVLVVAQARGECAPGGIFLLDPWQLATLGQAPRADARLVAVAGATICGLSAGGELACFDAADRAAPVLGASLRAGAATALAVDEADLVLGWPEGGITVLSLPFEPAAAPRAALALGSAPVMALALGSGAAGRFLYAALDDGEELIVIDMDNPSGPAVVRRVAAPAAVHLAASGETLLLTARGAKPGGLYLFDLLDPAAPRLDARIPLQGCRAAALLGRRLFALTADEEGSDQAMLRVWSRDS